MEEKKDWKNKLYFGDNLNILREFSDEMVDLVYLDPPFNSQATYNVLFGEKNGSQSEAQIMAFEDTWHWGEEPRAVYDELVTASDRPSDLIEALFKFLGGNDMMAYLVMMTMRLKQLHRVLRSTGSIFLHCDPTASHYLKLIMDAIFDPRNFRNEIVWERTGSKSHMAKRFPNSHDILLFYAKSDQAKFNVGYGSYDENYLQTHYNQVEPSTGRRYRLDNLTNPNKNRPHLTYEFPPGSGTIRVWRWTQDRMMRAWNEGRVVITKEGGVAQYKRYLDEQHGTPCKTVWTDIRPINSQAKERLGYPTQKPEALLERIIKAGSDKGDLVLDPFCGCGTTIAVAERLKRRWIGIDITYLAITLIQKRLESAFPEEEAQVQDTDRHKTLTITHRLAYEIIGDPRDLTSARALAEKDRHEFERWALGKIGAASAQDKKKGADRGIDGRLKFLDLNNKSHTVIVQVKSGKVTVSQIRDLIGVLKREGADMGVFLTLFSPTRDMKTEALSQGYHIPLDAHGHPDSPRKVPAVQILTIEDLLGGSSVRLPASVQTTFKRAERKYKEEGLAQPELGNEGEMLTS